jgi:flagellar motor switch protein FliN/FliY
MTQDVTLPQLQAQDLAPAREPGDLQRLSAVPVDLAVEIGRTQMTVGETLDLREGSVITLNRMADEPVDLLVNGVAVARGEVVVIDEQFGLRLTKVLDAERPGEAGADAGLVADAATGVGAGASGPDGNQAHGEAIPPGAS